MKRVVSYMVYFTIQLSMFVVFPDAIFIAFDKVYASAVILLFLDNAWLSKTSVPLIGWLQSLFSFSSAKNILSHLHFRVNILLNFFWKLFNLTIKESQVFFMFCCCSFDQRNVLYHRHLGVSTSFSKLFHLFFITDKCRRLE